MAEKKLEVDMAFFQTVQDFVDWKKQGKLLKFKPDGFDQIYPNFRDADGAYMALSANALTYAYNTAGPRRGRAEVGAGFPQAHVRRQGDHLSIRPTTTPRSICSISSCRSTAGAGWTSTWPTSRTSCRATCRWRAASPRARTSLTFDASSSVWEFQRQGKLEVVWSAEDETPVFTLTGGIFKDAPHPNAAKLYVTWFLAKEQQSQARHVLARAPTCRRRRDSSR